MHGYSDPAFIMPILLAVVVLIIFVVLILVNGKTRQTQSLSIKAFEELANELKADNAILKAELADMKETLKSINAMMEEIQ